MSINRQRKTQVWLNVYDLDPERNSTLYGCGLGFYHTGIQLDLKEFTFAGHNSTQTGIAQVPPKVNHPNFRQSILLGQTSLSYRQIFSILDEIKQKFPGNSYHLMKKNCNTFTNCFSQAILHVSIPSWVNRMANIGKFFIESFEFLTMKSYESKYETDASRLGVKSQKKVNVFESKKGIAIG